MITNDEFLERVVAGIQSIETSDAQAAVHWNEKIGGRQFDVVVRFQLALSRYLVLIEVKNHKRKTEARDIEAFVTKAGDKGADKVVFVNKVGYQDGAIQVARTHSVDLFTVSFDAQNLELSKTAGYISITKLKGPNVPPPTVYLGERQRVVALVNARLVYADGSCHEIPSEPSQMTYYLRRTQCSDGRRLADLVTGNLPAAEDKQTLFHRIALNQPLSITPPDEYFYPAGMIVAIDCEVAGGFGRPIEGNVRIDPSTFAPPVIYRNALTGEELTFPIHTLPLGMTEVRPFQFYFIENPLRYFYCAAIQGDRVSWRLIESFQDGDLVRCAFSQNIKYARFYIPISDRKILERLERRLRDFDGPSNGTRRLT